MSFSYRTKNELSRLPIENNCCAKAELAALVRMNGSIQIRGNQKVNLQFSTENAAIARRIFSLLKKTYDADVRVLVKKNKQLKKNNNYYISVRNTEETAKILEDVGLINVNSSNGLNIDYNVPIDLINSKCCKRAYIRGAFLGAGSISNPEKTYHLEFVVRNMNHSKSLSELINSFGLNSKIVIRKENFVVYLKEGEQIVDLLNIMGAHNSLLKLEDIRVLKDVRNNVNRLVNCETANLEKTINASMRQIENIEYIDKTIGLEELPDNLYDLAKLRIKHRDATLKELGMMLNPPVGKSGVNHRFRKIEDIAENLRNENGDKSYS